MRRLKPLIEKDEWKQQTQNYSTTFFGDGPSNDVMPELIQEYSKICSDSLLSVQCFARGSQSLSILKNSWGEERRTLIARTAKALIDDFNGDANEEHQIPQQPPSDAVEEEHKLFQDRWRQLETAWKITRQSFDATIEKAVKLITAVSNGPVKFEPEASLILELHALAWIHHVIKIISDKTYLMRHTRSKGYGQVFRDVLAKLWEKVQEYSTGGRAVADNPSSSSALSLRASPASVSLVSTSSSPAPSTSPPATQPTYQKMNVQDLRRLCREQKLSTKGTKAELIKRLEIENRRATRAEDENRNSAELQHSVLPSDDEEDDAREEPAKQRQRGTPLPLEKIELGHQGVLYTDLWRQVKGKTKGYTYDTERNAWCEKERQRFAQREGRTFIYKQRHDRVLMSPSERWRCADIVGTQSLGNLCNDESLAEVFPSDHFGLFFSLVCSD